MYYMLALQSNITGFMCKSCFWIHFSLYINYGSYATRVRSLVSLGSSRIRICVLALSMLSWQETDYYRRPQSASHPLSVSNAAVVSVIRLEVWVASVPSGVHSISFWSGVSQKAICPLRVNIHLTDRDHLC